VGSTPTASAWRAEHHGIHKLLTCECGGMVDTLVLGTSAFGRVGSTPSTRTSWEPWVMRSLWLVRTVLYRVRLGR
jgi:hypothetical protein